MYRRYYHYSKEPIGEVISQRQYEPSHKPRGLWVSVNSSWKEWCRSNDFGIDRLAVKSEIKLVPKANILELTTAADLDAFTEVYLQKNSSRGYLSSYNMDWARVATEYSGIVITPYIYARRLSETTGWYYTWDCASGCIWDKDVIKSVKILANSNEPA